MRQPTSEEWTRINKLFDGLADIPEAQWADSIATAKVDAFVGECVLSMLRANRRTGMLDMPQSGAAQDGAPPKNAAGYSSLDQGALVGAFRVVRLIGRGGMGEVYLAERAEGFDQRVALKLLRPEAANRMAMFDAERQVLAQLEHPGIARLIDGGIASDGRPYMALEYVDGEPITTWCAAHHASLEQRLRMMIDVCEAVSYAHARLVVHRDIKPGNILVDSEGRVRLLDFGIAKLIGDDVPDQTLTQAMLTPDYGAPEQFRRDAVTIATDIYALGGVLYELLVGRGAWRRDGSSGHAQIMRMIFDEPEPPSRIAGKLPDPMISARRIEGDLDAIVIKAMRHEPAARYSSAAMMAQDIQRHLAFEPVEARQGAFGYQLRRFARRHRAAAFAASVAVFALIAGSGGIAWQAHRAATERDIAETQARRAEAVNQAVVLMFRNAQESGQGESETAKGLLNDSADRLLASFGDKSPDTAPVVLALSDLYIEIADMAGAETLLRAALDKGIGRDDPVTTARLMKNLAGVEGMTGKFDEATTLLDQTEPIWAKDPVQFRNDRLETIAARAQILRLEGKTDQALKLLLDSQPEAELEYADDPRTLLLRYNNLAVHLLEANRFDEGERQLDRAQALIHRAHMESSPLAISILSLRAGMLGRKNDDAGALAAYQKAVDLRRKTYGASASLAVDLMQTGLIQMKMGRYADAASTLQEAQAMSQQFIGATNAVTAMASFGLAAAYGHAGDATRARDALALSEPAIKAAGTENALYGNYLLARVQVDSAEHRYDDAERDLDAVDALRKRLGGAGAGLDNGARTMRAALVKDRQKAGK